MASSPSQGKVEILNYKSAEGVFLVLSGAPSFSYSEAQSLNGKNGNETEPPAFVPRNLLLEAKREIRVLQERCRELENGVNTLRGQNEKLKEDNNKFLQQFGEFEVTSFTMQISDIQDGYINPVGGMLQVTPL